MARRLAAIMFTDLVGSTRTAQQDERVALNRQVEQEQVLRPIFRRHGGREIKSTGDGFLVEFDSALRATECAAEAQHALWERNSQRSGEPLLVRIGIHLGDVEPRHGDIFGDAVNIASRIEPLAEPGGVCLSEPVYVQVRNKLAHPLETLGPMRLKGVRDPVEVFRVVFPWSSPVPVVAGPLLPRIAVLPLANISPDPEDAYFADGLTEELISVLSQIKGLRVISHTSVNQYKGSTKPLAQIGSELGAETLLEGSVRKSGDQLRISVQLIDARTDEHRWSETYDRKFENVFAIQADVAERTAGALRVELLKPERDAIQERPTSSLAAYTFYLKGLQATRPGSRPAREYGPEAVQFFESAIREDPEFSAAYAHLAIHLVLMAGEILPVRETFARARELAEKALKLNPNSSDAHTALGSVLMQADLDWARAETEFQQAIALNPSSSTAHTWYGFLLWTIQRHAEAKKQALTAIELDPLWVTPRECLVDAYYLSGDLDSAIDVAEKIGRIIGETRQSARILSWLYAHAGRADDATKFLASFPGTDLGSRLHRGLVLGQVGKLEELSTLMDDAENGRIAQPFFPPYRAMCYAVLGEKEEAFAELEKDPKDALWNTYQERLFDGIRDDPRFVAILRASNLPTTLSRPR